MLNTIQQQMISLKDPADQTALGPVLRALADRLSSQLVSTGGLVIKAGGSAIVKAGSALYALANGILVTKAANTDMAALVGTVTNAKFNLYAFYIDSAGKQDGRVRSLSRPTWPAAASTSSSVATQVRQKMPRR
jgi:hypothetical protein